MPFSIRPFRPSDLPAVYSICLRTGDRGGDASALYRDGALLGHYYAAPYAVLEPDLCHVVADGDEAPAGYILGTRDSAAFRARTEQEWFPALRRRLPAPAPADTSPDAGLLRLIHAGYEPPPGLEDYPAHLHIDLLPAAQGQGLGRRLIDAFLDRLRAAGVRGVHLGVSAANTNAVGFYERTGFQRLQTHADWYAYGRRL